VSQVSRYSKYDPAMTADGLFMPRANIKKRVDIKRKHNQGTVRFLGPQLGVLHQSVLLAICARIGMEGGHVRPAEAKDDKKAVVELLDASDVAEDLRAEAKDDKKAVVELPGAYDGAKDQHVGLLETSTYALMLDAGMSTGGKQYERLIECLTELAAMTIYRSVKGKGGISRVISFSHIGDQLTISVNWRLTAAIFGAQNVQISLKERNQLGSSAAKILHTFLCAHTRLGTSFMAGQPVKINTLKKHIFGEPDRQQSRSAVYKQKKQLTAALEEVSQLDGWVIESVGNDLVRITRPKLLP